MVRFPRRWTAPAVGSWLVLLMTLVAPRAVDAQPAFSKVFAPDTIGPASTTTLTFVIDNTSGAAPVTDLAFTDTLPAGVTIASPSAASTSCTSAVLSAPAGGTTITMTGGQVVTGQSCTVSVNVTSATPGVHMNVSGDLTSSAGNSGTASDDLVVDTGRPGFIKLFTPSTIPVGGRSTLTFTVDNTANASAVANLLFTDHLPAGLEIAGPSNAATTCGSAAIPPTLTATPGTRNVSLDAFGTQGFPAVPAAATCSVTVDVTAMGAGFLDNVSGELQAGPNFESSGRATARLTVTATPLGLAKSFVDDPTPPGRPVTLAFTIVNRHRDFAATGVAFDDVLSAPPGLAPVGPLPAAPCGPGSTLTFAAGTLSLSGGSVAPGGACTFSVALGVPPGTAPGAYGNTTGPVTGTVDGAPVTGNVAADTLFVAPVPRLTKTFLNSPVGAGEDVTIRFSIENTSAASGATDIAFIDELTTFVPFPVTASLPGTPCGAGSSMTLVSLGTDRQGLSLTGGVLGPAAVCTFDVVVTLPAGLPGGTYTNTTEVITATVDGVTRTGNPATASFEVLAAPTLRKQFVDDPVHPGGQVTLTFTLAHAPTAPAAATGITFTDDLAAALTGLAATGLPASDVCGAGSILSGTTVLTLTGGSLAPGASCTFGVTLQVPPAALPGAYQNTTANVTAVVMGHPVTGRPASDRLLIPSLVVTKAFGGPVVPGGLVSLTFDLQNVTAAGTINSFAFTDNLAAGLPGLSVQSTVDSCSNGSVTVNPGPNLIFTGGPLAPGEPCSFSFQLMVSSGAADGVYRSTTSAIAVTVDGNGLALDPVSALLTVDSSRLRLTKVFTDDPVAPGATATLAFTIANLDAGLAATDLAFTDDLDAALAGLTAIGLPRGDVCGAGSELTGAGRIALTGGRLAPGGSCTFSVTVQVPAGAAAGTYRNITSEVTGVAGGLAVRGDPARDDLRVSAMSFSKAFGGPAVAGGTVVLGFTLTNLSGGAVGSLAFLDDLDAVVPGLRAIGLPAAAVCGSGSSLSGTSVLALSGASLPAGGSCTFSVTLLVPPSAAPGNYVNTTSELRSAGLGVAAPAVAVLAVNPTPPAFRKTFVPGSIVVGEVSTLLLTIDNSASPVPATGLAFTDALPAPLLFANPANATSTCSGGTLTAVPGTGTLTYAGGAVDAHASCTIRANVTSDTAGSFLNVAGPLTSSLGSSGTASAVLQVAPLPPPVRPGGLATGPGEGGAPLVRFFNAEREERSGLVFDPSFTGGVRVALGDVNGDGVLDVIAAAGPGAGPHVRVFSGADRRVLHSFDAYPAGFSAGVFVAAGDVDGDGHADIITGAGAGDPHVKIFSGVDLRLLHSFFALPAGFRGGVRVAAGDVDGDGRVDLVVGAGPGSLPLVRVGRFLPDGTLNELASGLAYEPGFTGGVFVAAGDVDDDGQAEVIVGPGQGRAPLVHVVDLAPDGRITGVMSGLAYAATFLGGVRVAAGNVDGTGRAEIVVAPGPGAPNPVRVFAIDPGAVVRTVVEFFAYGPGFRGGVFVAAP